MLAEFSAIATEVARTAKKGFGTRLPRLPLPRTPDDKTLHLNYWRGSPYLSREKGVTPEE